MTLDEAAAFLVANRKTVDTAQIAVAWTMGGEHFITLGLEGLFVQLRLPENIGEMIVVATRKLIEASPSHKAKIDHTMASIRADLDRIASERPNGSFEGWKPPAGA